MAVNVCLKSDNNVGFHIRYFDFLFFRISCAYFLVSEEFADALYCHTFYPKVPKFDDSLIKNKECKYLLYMNDCGGYYDRREAKIVLKLLMELKNSYLVNHNNYD